VNNLTPYIIRRGIQTILTIFLIVILNFFIINLAPGDPIRVIAGEFAFSNPEYVEALRKRWGLDKPVSERLFIYLNNLLHGDMGFSFRYMQPVAEVIGERILATLLLTFTSLILAFIIGVSLGVYSARRIGKPVDLALSFTMLLLYSMPVFWLGILLILFFGVHLRLFPIAGMFSSRVSYTGIFLVADVLWHMFLPVSTLTLAQLPIYYKITKASVIEQFNEDYVRTFKAYGLNREVIFKKYILRNAILPPITIFGLQLGFVLSGAALVEIIFGWPGMGRLLLDAAFYRDYPLLMGLYLVTAVSVALANLLTDLTYVFLDPRVKLR